MRPEFIILSSSSEILGNYCDQLRPKVLWSWIHPRDQTVPQDAKVGGPGGPLPFWNGTNETSLCSGHWDTVGDKLLPVVVSAQTTRTGESGRVDRRRFSVSVLWLHWPLTAGAETKVRRGGLFGN